MGPGLWPTKRRHRTDARSRASVLGSRSWSLATRAYEARAAMAMAMAVWGWRDALRRSWADGRGMLCADTWQLRQGWGLWAG